MTAPFSTSERTESLMDWFQLYSRQVIWGGVAIVALGAGGWFYTRSQELKAERAAKAYLTAQRSVAAGNLPLAESDLGKLISRYDGTPASMQARLQLAQVLYDQGKYQAGIDQLKGVEGKMGKSIEFGSAVHLVMASGHEQLKKFNEAAAEYEQAAKAARFDEDRQRYSSLAAAAYLDAGDKEKAKTIWTELGADSKGTVAGEARVRLGEMAAQTAPKS
ncbi:MAG: tetratricopeptide repeat protein [Gemmatimonadaceae bacterium]